MHKVLVNLLVNHTQEKRVVRRLDCPDLTIAVDLDVNQTKQELNSRDCQFDLNNFIHLAKIICLFSDYVSKSFWSVGRQTFL